MAKLEKKLQQLPSRPGVYFHKNKAGKIIYVGKAASLRNRVRQYFQKSRTRDPKTEVLINQIYGIDWLETESEIDALFLEAELIKRYKPRFNIEMRDDKSNLYVRIDIKSSHPTVSFTRRPLDDGAEYFGPFHRSANIKRAMRYLRRIFPYDYKKPRSRRVSLDFHIGLSPGLEEEKKTLSEYRADLKKLRLYLRGKRQKLFREIESEMKQAAKNEKFEKAAGLRNQLLALKDLRKQIVFGDKEFIDISKDKALAGLAEILSLPKPPRRIEGYDVSHQQGSDNVASMVVFLSGMPAKSHYRKFKMRSKGNDDYAHIYEALSRRFSKRNTAAWPLPDLVVIDGGKGQLSAGLKAMGEAGFDIPALGLAKRREQIIAKSDSGFKVISSDKDSHVSKLLQRIRDEAHRFALSYHSSLKGRRQTASMLEEIPTVGPQTRKKLIKTFGSLGGVLKARQWEIEKAVGPSKAALIKQYLRPTKR